MDLMGKKVLVCGMAKSGVSAALLLAHKGAAVTLQDLKGREELPEADALEKQGIAIYSGKNPDDIIKEQSLIVVSPGIPCDLPFFQLAEEYHIPVISEVELSYLFTPCPIIAITGTNGKTTTTTLAGEMIKTQYPNGAVVGNIGVPFSSQVEHLTEKDYVVAEISSFQLETARTFRPKISAVLNITPDHLNRHKTLENYIAMKEKIFARQKAGDICILNYEDSVCRKMAGKTEADVFFFSSERPLANGIYLENGNMIIKWGDLDETVLHTKELQILGKHNYENAMAATAASVCAGVPLSAIRETLRSFTGVAHRIEYVATVNGVDYYNDSKGTNPDAAIRAVEAMVKPIVLIGGGYDKDSQFDDWVKTFPGHVKHLVLIGATADKIEKTCEQYGFCHITRAASFPEAVAASARLAGAGDCVLLSPACASWDMFKSYEQRGDIFKELVRDMNAQ